MYVARYTHNPQQDIERGYSCHFGDASYMYDAYEAQAEEKGLEPLSIEEWAQENDVVWNDDAGMWQEIHHYGLSCWALTATTEAEALKEAQRLNSEGGIRWGGTGQRTIGNVKLIARADEAEPLYIFWCEDAANED